MSESFPVHKKINTKSGRTIYKSDDWWKAAVLYEIGGELKVGVYLWTRTEDGWTRKQKYAVSSEDDWKKERKVVDSLIENLH